MKIQPTLVLLCLLSTPVTAATLAVVELETTISHPDVAVDTVATTYTSIGPNFPFRDTAVSYSGLDAGSTLQWTANAATAGADFAGYAAALTNGRDDALEVVMSIGSAGAFDYRRELESTWFATVTGRVGPDLAGFIVDALTLTVTDIDYTAASNTLSSRTMLTIEGRVVPLPGAGLLLLSAVAVGLRRWG